jgi:hypothetical protein
MEFLQKGQFLLSIELFIRFLLDTSNSMRMGNATENGNEAQGGMPCSWASALLRRNEAAKHANEMATIQRRSNADAAKPINVPIRPITVDVPIFSFVLSVSNEISTRCLTCIPNAIHAQKPLGYC